MVRFVVVIAAFVLAVAALPAEVPEVAAESPEMPADVPEMAEPGQLALEFTEEEFEDYLDKWFEEDYYRRMSNGTNDVHTRSGGCQFRVNGDLGQPQPVYIHNYNYLRPDGNSGIIRVGAGQSITIACPGNNRQIRHPRTTADVHTAVATCASGNQVAGPGWLNGNDAFGGLICNSHPIHDAENTNERCYQNFPVIRVGFWVQGAFYPVYRSCFNPNRMEVLYVWTEQNPHHAVHQTNVDRPNWLAGSFFPGTNINQLYTQVNQKTVVTNLVGQNLADKYITNHQFLARGHLVAKSDMTYATGQRATFYFINSIPQWQPFNAGNWNWLEQNLRARIGEAGYHTTIWTGAFGVTQLRNQQNRLVDFYLHNNNRLPVPEYMYKVVYDAGRRLGTAFISINNPHYSAAEVRSLQFCTDRCRGNSAFNWLRWQPDRIDLGYSFCCTVDEFRRKIPHLPNFVTNGLLA